MKRMRTAIHISGLRKQYSAVTALDGLDLDVAEGEMFGLPLLRAIS